MRLAVRTYNTVADEVSVARSIFAEITAVCPEEEVAVLVIFGKCLIYPVPDESALEMVILVDVFPLKVERTGRVTHRMRIFRRTYRTARRLFSHSPEPVIIRILRYDHIRIPFKFSSFVTYRAVHAVLFKSLDLVICIVEVASVSTLVTEREDRHAGIVPSTEIHVADAVDMVGIPLRLVSEGLVKVVEHSVALDIGLRIDIESKAVAEVIEHTRLRIMAGSDTIDIVLLHQFKVLKHPFTAHIMSCVRICLMKVHTLELDRLSVDIEDISLDLKTAEAHIEACIFTLYTEKESIELRSLGSPLPHIFHDSLHHCISAVYKTAVLKDNLIVLVNELVRDIKVAGRKG